jgi:MFS transporter, YNFM family, putative membrane transport protein
MHLVSADTELPPELAYHRPGEAGYRRLILALFAAGVATFAALYSTQPLLGLLATDFARPASRAAWSVSVTTLLLGIGMLVAGPLSDRWGATGLYIAGTAIGGMTGRLVAGGVADLAGWRWALAAIAALGGLCALAVVAALPASRHGLRSGAADGTRPVPGTAVPGGWRHALSAAGRVVQDRQLLCLYLIGGTSMGAFVAVYNVLGLRLTTAPYHLSVFGASLVFCVYTLGSASAAVAGRLAERLGRPAVVLAGGLFATAGVAVSLASPLPVVILGIAMITAGFFAAHGIASGWAASAGQDRQAASQASAFYLLAYYLGSSVFGVLGTNLWETGRWPAVAVMAGALFLAAAVTAAAAGGAQARQTRPRRPSPWRRWSSR